MILMILKDRIVNKEKQLKVVKKRNQEIDVNHNLNNNNNKKKHHHHQ